MEMKHGLPAVGVSVYYNPITIFGETPFTGDTSGRQKKMAERLRIVLPGFIQRVDMVARNDENMSRRLRTKIVERDAYLIFEHASRRYLVRYDLAENAALNLHIQ